MRISQGLIALVGPTASGKTAASLPIAEALGAEIVNIDANLVYRGMDVWTGKPDQAERRRVPHHLIDLTDPVSPVGVAEFQRLARVAIDQIVARGRRPFIVGASGLYFRAIVDGLEFPGTEPAARGLLEAEASILGPAALHRRLADLDPEAAARIDPRNARRTVRALEVAAITGRPFSSFARDWKRYPPEAVTVAGIEVPRAELHRRIEDRDARLFPSLLAETRSLLDRRFGRFIASFHVMGYAEAAACLEGTLGSDEALARIVKQDKALARRQLSWFRRDPRIRWFRGGTERTAALVEELVAYFRAPDRVPATVEA